MTTKAVKIAIDQVEILNSPPWPEWSDAYINNLQWLRNIKHSMYLSQSSTKLKPAVLPTNEQTEESYFDDPAGLVEMPSDINVHRWKRPHEISPETSYVLEPDTTPLDLVTHNKHLFGYEIMRMIISSITCLQRESFYRPFPVEFQTEQFVANGGAEWKPWYHVYALTLAGKGQLHKPQYNPYGKYVIRLFFLGKWRRILVDDKLPVDEQGQVLLPMSQPHNLWLPLLSKALLKVACLSWLPSAHCVDFSVIHCLTGWIQTQVPSKCCSMYHLWCVCCQLMSTTEEVVLSPGCCEKYQEDGSCTEENMGHSAVGSRAILATISSSVDGLRSLLTPLKSAKKDFSITKSATKLMSNFHQTVLISNVRYNSDQPLPLWKQYRWNEWAHNKGLISEIPYKPVRNIQVYNPWEVYPESIIDIDNPVRNEAWLDFETFVRGVRTLEVYYKPSYFKYSLRAWSTQDLLRGPQVSEDIVIKPPKKPSTKEKGGGDSKSVKSKSQKAESPEKSSDVLNKVPSTKATPNGKSKKRKEDDKDKVEEEWPKNLREPSFFYLLIDSKTSKEMLVSMSVFSPEGTPYAIIFIGRYEWHSPSVAPIIERMSTTATSARFFVLPPGLRVFRIWHQFPEYFCLQFFSNTNFQSGTKMFIQKCLTFDSMSYKFYSKEISSSFEQLLAAPQGGAEHGRAFQKMMMSLDPPHLRTQLPWPEGFCVHTDIVQTFEDSLTEMLVESIHHVEDVYQTLQAFQLLFLNPVFGMKTLKSIKPEYYEYIIEQEELQRQKEIRLQNELKEHLAQAAEQKSSKGAKSDKVNRKAVKTSKTDDVTIKSEKTKDKADKKDKDRPKCAAQNEQLRKLIHCKEKNLLINDPVQAILLLKKIVSKLPHLRYLYPFNFEDDIKLLYRDYTGEVQSTGKWVALVRCVLNIHSTEPVPCSLHVWSPLKNLVLRLINNDSSEDVLPLGLVENNVAYLTRNSGGYTLCIYGLTTNNTSVPWRLRSMGMREVDCLHVCEEDVDACSNSQIHPAEQSQQTVQGYYVPNKQNIIASCLLEVFRDVMVLMHLQVSYKYALCRFTVTDEHGEVVVDTSGMGYLMVPALNLKGSSSESEGGEVKPLIYRVTATLLEKSWPLQLPQMIAMLHYKEQLPAILQKEPEKPTEDRTASGVSGEKRSSSRTKSSAGKFSRSTKVADTESAPSLLHFGSVQNKPSWSLTLVTDLQKEMPVTLRLDTSLYDTINELKAQWIDEGFNLQNCRDLRQEFLNTLPEETEEEYSEESIFKLKPKNLDKLTARYGKKVSDEWWQDHFPTSMKSVSSRHTQTTISAVSQHTLTGVSVRAQTSVMSMASTSKKSSPHSPLPPSTSTSEDTSISSDSVEKMDHTNVLVQQAGIHKALQNIRLKTLEHNQEVFRQTSVLREKILNDMKFAKEAELGTKSESDKKKEKKSKDASPTNTKGKGSTMKDAKKPKGGKGKGK